MIIQVIFTGGTIGGDLRNGRSIVDAHLQAKVFRARLYDAVKEEPLLRTINLPEFRTPLNKFSEQMTPKDWGMIAAAVFECATLPQPPDGIVILHGTDTLSFTAAALSFLLRGITIPVVITGSTWPLMAQQTDAKRNFLDAVRVATERRFTGVFVSFSGDANTPSTIHAGTRARKMSFPTPATFHSINTDPIGRIRNSLFVGQPSISVENEALLKHIRSSNEGHALSTPGTLNENMAYFQIFPGFSPENIDRAVDRNSSGIILDLYNSGTACTEGPLSLLRSIKAAVARGVPVFATSQHLGPTEMQTYGSSFELKEAGVIPLHDMCHEAAITKLMCVRGRLSDRREYNEVIRLMTTDWCGELIRADRTQTVPRRSAAM